MSGQDYVERFLWRLQKMKEGINDRSTALNGEIKAELAANRMPTQGYVESLAVANGRRLVVDYLTEIFKEGKHTDPAILEEIRSEARKHLRCIIGELESQPFPWRGHSTSAADNMEAEFRLERDRFSYLLLTEAAEYIEENTWKK